jgi:hypothetical protein
MRLTELHVQTLRPWVTMSVVRGYVNRGIDFGRRTLS